MHQEVNRKLGFGIQPEEEKLRTILESNLAELSAPTQFKVRPVVSYLARGTWAFTRAQASWLMSSSHTQYFRIRNIFSINHSVVVLCMWSPFSLLQAAGSWRAEAVYLGYDGAIITYLRCLLSTECRCSALSKAASFRHDYKV